MAFSEGSASRVCGFDIKADPKLDEDKQDPSIPKILAGSPLPVGIPPVLTRTPRVGQNEEHRPAAGTQDQVLPANDTAAQQGIRRPAEASERTTKKGHKKGKTKKDRDTKKRQTNERPPGGQKGEAMLRGSLFDHLDPFKPFVESEMHRRDEAKSIHPSFIQFCVSYAKENMNDSAACRGMLDGLLESLETFDNNQSVFYNREYLGFVVRSTDFLFSCRPPSVAMQNLVRAIKVEAMKLEDGVVLEEGKQAVQKMLQGFMEERVDVAHIIAREADALIMDNDVILTYSSSDTVRSVLSFAWREQKRQFRVVVVDSRPDLGGKQLLKDLSEIGIPCSYSMINALGFVLKDVSKVMIGASAVLSNGAVVGRAGSATVAMMAHANHIPTVICCQTLKFHERVQLDSFTHNELGDSADLIPKGVQQKVASPVLNIRYDLMPAKFVSIIVSELGFIPASSVPVILRDQSAERDTSHI